MHSSALCTIQKATPLPLSVTDSTAVSVPWCVLQKAISMAIRDLGLQHWPSQIDKVRQLHSQVSVRHGVMLVGPTGGGKSAVRNILQKALVLLPMLMPQDGAKHDVETKRHGMFLVSLLRVRGRILIRCASK